MAKKKKPTPRKKKVEVVEKSPFWALSGAVLMIIAALFLIIGGFGTGGWLPISLFHAVYWALGWAAWLAPIALVFFGVHKFVSEDNQIPLAKFVSMVVFVTLSAAWLDVAFAVRQADTFIGGKGGMVGQGIGNSVLTVLDGIPASLLFIVFGILAFFFAFGISPKAILKLGDLFKRPEADPELAELKQKAEPNAFKLNEGVPVEHHNQARMSSFRNSAQKLAPADNHAALTAASDPN
jgi:hypothetical protein